MTNSQPHLLSANGEPTWEVTQLFPRQGQWTEDDFFRIHSNQMAELVDGRLEILPMPTWLHQKIVAYLFGRMLEHVQANQTGGDVLFAPLPTTLFPGTVREPDLLYVSSSNVPRLPRSYPDKIDLAIEVVSEGGKARQRDYVDKRVDYAKAGVTEYWIVDPQEQLVTVLSLRGSEYEVSQECHPGETANSLLLAGLSIPTNEIWALGSDKLP